MTPHHRLRCPHCGRANGEHTHEDYSDAGDCVAPRPVMLPHGHLPTLGYFVIHSGLSPADARALLNGLRASLRKNGPCEAIRLTLVGCGFAWTTPTVSDLDMDVARVADALSGFRAADNDDGEAA